MSPTQVFGFVFLFLWNFSTDEKAGWLGKNRAADLWSIFAAAGNTVFVEKTQQVFADSLINFGGRQIEKLEMLLKSMVDIQYIKWQNHYSKNGMFFHLSLCLYYSARIAALVAFKALIVLPFGFAF